MALIGKVFARIGIPLILIIFIAAPCLFLNSILRNITAPIDASRFNTNRQHLSEDLPIEEIAPLQIGGFTRKELSDAVASLNFEREIRAVYENELGQRVDLSAYLDTQHIDDHDFLSNIESCGECGISNPIVHTDTEIAYGYDFCGCWFFAHHRFRWINGDWKLSASSASTLKSDGETLLTFLSSYLF